MPMTLEQLEDEAMKLPAEDRVRLADTLLVRSEPALKDAEELWFAEAHRRLDELRSGAEQDLPAEEVFARARMRRG